MECREHCAACCIVPHIQQAYYGMPEGKKAGERCVHLDANDRCLIFGDPRRPSWCIQFKPEPEFCGSSKDEAIQILIWMNEFSAPNAL
jgi:hypothetical protein